jgi:hypothetical protein
MRSHLTEGVASDARPSQIEGAVMVTHGTITHEGRE